ncbi:zinc-binding domain-containing protein [Colletotrichum cereale]|nr:zinc-binding domain-containing protein [Colletotrichum cereale]
MAKKKSFRSMAETSFEYPSLHEEVSEAVSEELPSTWFNTNGSGEPPNNQYFSNVMGEFRCDNDNCAKKKWTSKIVAIVIKGYPENGYSAIVFNQRCASCNHLGNFTLDKQSYVERVAYRLKKWAGVKTNRPYYAEKDGPPHQADLCEGCKRGYCQRRNASGVRLSGF